MIIPREGPLLFLGVTSVSSLPLEFWGEVIGSGKWSDPWFHTLSVLPAFPFLSLPAK